MSLVRYSVQDVTPGMILGRPVLSNSGSVMLGEAIELTQTTITRLVQLGISELYILEQEKEKTNSIPIFDDVVSPAQETFLARHADITVCMKMAFQKARLINKVPVEQVISAADQVQEFLVDDPSVLYFLHRIEEKDDYTFRHSVNVGIIAGVIGKWLGYGQEQLKEVILAGLLHDIGKTQVPLEILNKPGKLTADEMQVMRQHSALGYQLLKSHDNLPTSVLLAVLQHHERMDGSGYPLRVPYAKIAFIARIVALADTYDAMTSKRVYKNAVTPFDVIEEIFREMFDKLDPQLSALFLDNLRESLVGYMVRLSSGMEAKVIYFDKNRAVRPVVLTASGTYIDLEKSRDITIKEIIV